MRSSWRYIGDSNPLMGVNEDWIDLAISQTAGTVAQDSHAINYVL